MCFYYTWLNLQLNPQINWCYYWTGKDFENSPMTLSSESYRYLWVLLFPTPSPPNWGKKKITIYKWGAGVEEPRIGAIKYVAFEDWFCAYLWGVSSFAFIVKPYNWLDRVKTHHFFTVFLLKWISHFVFHKIIMQLHSTFFPPLCFIRFFLQAGLLCNPNPGPT